MHHQTEYICNVAKTNIRTNTCKRYVVSLSLSFSQGQSRSSFTAGEQKLQIVEQTSSLKKEERKNRSHRALLFYLKDVVYVCVL